MPLMAFCIAEGAAAYRHAGRAGAIALGALWLAGECAGQGAPRADPPASAELRPLAVARAAGRLTARDLGLVINTADPYSVEVGEYYARRRGLAPEQLLRVELPVRGSLSPEEFEALAARIGQHFGPTTQALALAWTTPYAVGCNSITGALALGYDAALCAHSCSPSTPSRYFNTSTARPFTDLGLRPSMLLAAGTAEAAKALIDRGVAADGLLRTRGRPDATALFLLTTDKARNVRQVVYPPEGRIGPAGVDVRVAPPQALGEAAHVILASTGTVRLSLPAIDWLPGALADHLTSVGGALAPGNTQSTVLEWIASGATASYGTVSEPCNHLQKFPHPTLLLMHYLQGETALEAYWKSVAWPQQGLFVGEPLAAPFATPLPPPARPAP